MKRLNIPLDYYALVKKICSYSQVPAPIIATFDSEKKSIVHKLILMAHSYGMDFNQYTSNPDFHPYPYSPLLARAQSRETRELLIQCGAKLKPIINGQEIDIIQHFAHIHGMKKSEAKKVFQLSVK